MFPHFSLSFSSSFSSFFFSVFLFLWFIKPFSLVLSFVAYHIAVEVVLLFIGYFCCCCCNIELLLPDRILYERIISPQGHHKNKNNKNLISNSSYNYLFLNGLVNHTS